MCFAVGNNKSLRLVVCSKRWRDYKVAVTKLDLATNDTSVAVVAQNSLLSIKL
jgi:hypothetical protein